MAEREEEQTQETTTHGVLGTLWLVAKKTGVDMQSFPIDADRVTIGRDWDSDIRLYFSDVSKLHCEIKFDLITGDRERDADDRATLHVHGTHGIKHTPERGETATYKPPSIIPLSNKDTFIVRKKLFRFEYGHEDSIIDTPPMTTQPLPSDSPVKTASPAPRRMKRNSHRMSLVPPGKNFEPLASPMKSRRHSIIGLGEGPQVIRTPKKSGLSEQIVEEEEIQEEEEEEVVVEAVDGEEGEILYFEVREEEQKSVHNNPFLTPQQKRKAPMRNTSAVPRTRKLKFETSSAHQGLNEDVDGTSSPRTPRSVPLPPTAETPYASAESTPAGPAKTPRSVPLPPADNTPYKVTAQVAMSTPRGPVSLHKALLLRSARKAWQDGQAKNVDGAIVVGDIETKRKSLSPKAQARRSLNSSQPPPDAQEDESEEDSAEDDEISQEELQWVYEDGRASNSIEVSDESMESLEADQSLDIPGQGVISFGPASAEAEEEEMNGEGDYSVDEEEEQYAQVEEDEGSFEAEEVEDESMEQEQGDEVEQAADESMEEDREDQVEEVAASNTPRRPLERFYTPQPQRTMFGAGPRRSLASIGGPAVPVARQPVTPAGPGRRMPGTPGSLGPPSRRIVAPVEDDDEDEEEAKPLDRVPSTPVRREVDPALLAEAKRRRETLGTPRALPTLPPSFKTPVREVSLRNIMKTPSHPALAPTTPDNDTEDSAKPDVPMTPLEKVQKELSFLRRQSVQRSQARNDSTRRATVSFALPSTPARPRPKHTVSTVMIDRRLPMSFATTLEEDEGASQPATPHMAGQDFGEVSTLETGAQEDAEEYEEDARELDEAEAEEFDTNEEVQDEIAQSRPRIPAPATPSFAGMKEMFRAAPVAPKTPSFAGIRSMFAGPSDSAPTPRLNGVREMFHQADQPSTPRLNGVREMFTLPQEASTPAMEGLKEMYEVEEVEEEAVLQQDTESEEEELVESFGEIVVVASPPKSKIAPVKKATASTAGKARAPVASTSTSAATKVARPTSKVPVASSSRTKPTAATAPAPAVETKPAAVPRKVAAPRARAAKAEPAPKKAVPTARIAVRPRPGDIDDVSLSEVEEPIEYKAPVSKPRSKPVPKATATAAASAEEVPAPKPKTVKATTTRAKKTEIPKPTTTRAASTSTSSRAKKPVLGENGDQDEVAPPAPVKATRAKKTVEKPTSTSTSASATTTKSTSAPSRRTKAVVEKENEPEPEGEKVVAVKKAPVRRTVKKVEPAVAIVEPVTTRATRSRK